MANGYESGSAVRSGYYLDAAQWRVVPVERDGDRLPAGKGTWRRIPTAAALLLVPVLGGIFLVFLPLVGFVLAARALATRLAAALRGPAAELAATVTPGWQPGEAHFTGKRVERAGAGEEAEAGGGLEALEREIERRRHRP